MNYNMVLPCIAACILGCGIAGGTSSTGCTALNTQAGATLDYTIRYQQEASPATLSVQLNAAGLHAPVRIGGGQRTSMRWNAERPTEFLDPPRR
jgi:hypothetical protein